MLENRPTFVIADDLSGALDASVCFARYGKKVRVALSPSSISEVVEAGADVIAVSTGSREVSEANARSRVREVLSEIPQSSKIIKKIDSRLKGHVLAETEVLLSRGFQSILVAPAIPKFGRIVKDGKLSGFGVDSPIPMKDIFSELNVKTIIPDTVCDADFDDALASLAPETLVVGASGVTGAIARMEGGAVSPFKVPKAKKVLIAIGSRDPITLAQIDTLRNTRSDIGFITCPNGYAPSMQPKTSVVLVQLTQGSTTEPAIEVAKRYARTVANIFDQSEPDTVIASGGETAQEVLAVLGIESLEIIGEARLGVPVSRCDLSGNGFKLITKSGGFGGDSVLLELLSDLQQ